MKAQQLPISQLIEKPEKIHIENYHPIYTIILALAYYEMKEFKTKGDYGIMIDCSIKVATVNNSTLLWYFAKSCDDKTDKAAILERQRSQCAQPWAREKVTNTLAGSYPLFLNPIAYLRRNQAIRE